MAGAVTIDSGPIDANDSLRSVPKEKWHDLMLARRQFMEINLTYDCRCLLQFVEDANVMFQPLGFKNVEAMIHEGYNLEPAEIDIAIEWLRLNPTDEPVPFERTLRSKAGRPLKNEENPCNVTRIKYGSKEHWEARLLRDKKIELLEKVRAKTISYNKAAIEAGYRKPQKPRSPLQNLRSAWKKASAEERETFLKEINP